MKKRVESFSLCGAGKVGVALSYQLYRLGYQPLCVWNRSAARLRKALQTVPFEKSTTELKHVRSAGNWLIIAVSDDAIPKVAHELAQLELDWSSVNVLHTSGFHAADVLQPLQKCGARTGALHPVISVPSVAQGKHSLATATYTCQGELAPELLKQVTQIGGRGFRVTPAQKKAIHIAAVFLNNYLMAVISGLRELGDQAGLKSATSHQILDPIVQQTLRKAWTRDLDELITGPVARGDQDTIQAHLATLQDFPGLKDIYKSVGRDLCQRLARDGEKIPEIFQELFDIKE